MNISSARRTWVAARINGYRPLSWRLYVTLLWAARPGGCYETTNGNACYDLQRAGLLEIKSPFAFATNDGRTMLAKVEHGASSKRVRVSGHARVPGNDRVKG